MRPKELGRATGYRNHHRGLGTICLIMLAPVSTALALEAPNDEQWQAYMDAAAAGTGAEAATLRSTIVGLFDQGIRFSADDARVARTADPLLQAIDDHYRLTDDDAQRALLEQLLEIANEPGGLASPLSIIPFKARIFLAFRERDFELASTLSRETAERAEADYGKANLVAQIARQAEVTSEIELGHTAVAAELFEQQRDQLSREFGPGSEQYASFLMEVADAYVDMAQLESLAPVLDELIEIVQKPDSLASIRSAAADRLIAAGRYEQALELLSLAEASTLEQGDSGRRTVLLAKLHASMMLASMRLLDGSAAYDHFLQGLTFAYAQPEPHAVPAQQNMLTLLYRGVELFSMAGMRSEARTVLEQLVDYLDGLAGPPVVRYQLAIAELRLKLGEYDKALELARQVMSSHVAGTKEHSDAAGLYARVSALMTPPVARLDLAEEALAYYEPTKPSRAQASGLWTLALAQRADGELREALQLEREALDSMLSLEGEQGVAAELWQAYAETLAQNGEQNESEAVMARIDSRRDALADGLQSRLASTRLPENAYESAFGFSIVLPDQNWYESTTKATAVAYAAASRNAPIGFSVYPFLLGDDVDSETGMLAIMNALQLSPSIREPWSHGEYVGYSFEYERTLPHQKPLKYQAHLIVRDKAVYLLVVGGDESDLSSFASTDAILDAIMLHEPSAPRQLTGRDRAVHGAMLSWLGAWALEQGRIELAHRTYREAAEYVDEPAVVASLAYIELELGLYEELVETTSRTSDYAAYPGLLIWRAFGKSQTGDSEGALADYAEGFSAGYVDDAFASEYVALLMDFDRRNDAAAFIDEYRIDHRTPDVIALEALIYFSTGNNERFEAALADLENPELGSPEAALVAALLYDELDGVDAAAEFAERAASAGLDSVELYAFLADLQLDKGRVRAAKATIDKGLNLAPNDPGLEEWAARIDTLLIESEL